MMAHWDLERFSRRLGDIANPVLLVHSRGDVAVPMGSVEAAAARIPDARLELMGDLGHLAHEEVPGQAAELIMQFAQAHGEGTG
ncbi:MAG: alpha/beta fold hydrolase [Erythrobacter sp.]